MLASITILVSVVVSQCGNCSPNSACIENDPQNPPDVTCKCISGYVCTNSCSQPWSGHTCNPTCTTYSPSLCQFGRLPNPESIACSGTTCLEAECCLSSATLTPTAVPTLVPTIPPTLVPTLVPTLTPTAVPTQVPTAVPTQVPTLIPTLVPTLVPTAIPTQVPTLVPTLVPTAVPTLVPTLVPTAMPTLEPTQVPTAAPTQEPTNIPTAVPTVQPTAVPTTVPPSNSPVVTLVPLQFIPTLAPALTPPPPPAADVQVTVTEVGKLETKIAIRVSGDNLVNNLSSGCISVKKVSTGLEIPILRVENITNAEVHVAVTTPENDKKSMLEERIETELKSCAVVSGIAAVSGETIVAVPGREQSKVEEQREMVQDMASATALPALMSGSPVEAGTLAILGLDCALQSEFSLSRVLHPTAITILDSAIVGCLVANLSLSIGCIVASIAVSHLVGFFTSYSTYSVQGMLRIPGAPLYLSFFLLNGGVFSTFYILINGEAKWIPICLLNLLFFVIIAPIIIWKVTSTATNNSNYTFDHRKYNFHQVMVFFLGSHEWTDKVPPSPIVYFQRFGLLYNRFTNQIPYGLLLKYILGCALAAASAVTSSSMIVCGHIRLIMTLFLAVYSTLLINKKPYRRSKDQVAELVLAGFKTAALLAAAIGFYSEDKDHVAFSASLMILQAAMVFFVIKVLVDMLAFLIVFVTRRQDKVRDASIHEECVGRLNGLEELLTDETPKSVEALTPVMTPREVMTPRDITSPPSVPAAAVVSNSSLNLFPTGLPPTGRRTESRNSRRSSHVSTSTPRRRASSPQPEISAFPLSPTSDRRRSSPLVDIVSPLQSPLSPPRSRRYSAPRVSIAPTRRRSLASTPLTVPFADLDTTLPEDNEPTDVLEETLPVKHENIRVVYT
eukprot:TRINITY_DN1517_c1_g1_i1.p1 TRINITY_DN1517_c1_g1~~TRINITY_DN1517_c1_g1_i1.p1  ORF type:complete len:899 (+),score=137.66 TRINITY_DN1517_c1_g1_i1:51-2747(+)